MATEDNGKLNKRGHGAPVAARTLCGRVGASGGRRGCVGGKDCTEFRPARRRTATVMGEEHICGGGPLNIAFVSKEFPPSPRSYGIGTYTHETAHALARLGHRVTVICAADVPAAAGISMQGQVLVIRLVDDELPVGGWNRHLWQEVEKALAYRRRVAECLDRLIDEDRAEVVEFPGFRGESHIWAKGRRRIPMVVRMHGFTGWVDSNWKDILSATRRLQKRFEAEELLAADRITLVAEHLRAAVNKRLTTAATVTTVYNSIDTQRWSAAANDNADGIGPKDIVFAGSLTKVKGIFDLIDATERLRRRTAWTGILHLFGRTGGEFSHYVRKRWGSAGTPCFVRVHGAVSRDILPSVYRSAGVCCFPSRIEPFGYTVIEASASRGLVIGTRKTGIAELMEDGITGYLADPGNPEMLSATLQRALSMSSDAAQQMRDDARAHVAAQFDSTVIISRMIGVYSEIVAQRMAAEGKTRCC